MDNKIPQMMGKLSQMINMYKGDYDTPTLTKSMIWPYKAGFMKTMNLEIK